MYQSTASTDQYAFEFRYNEKGLCTYRKNPGAQYVTYEYDWKDRLAYTQDGVQRSAGKWTFYTYDGVGRPSSQGENTSKASSTSGEYLKNYYDNYNFVGSTGFTSSLYTRDTSLSGWGKLTGQVISVLGGSSHSYTFGYDGVGRLLTANHGAGTYTELVNGYDKNGNIKFLKRTCGSSTLADDLTYTYSGNRITKVEDAAGTSGLFSNGSTATTEYTYDNNGNLKSDLNKGISNITYNCLYFDKIGCASEMLQ
jgi:hypothetical protein